MQTDNVMMMMGALRIVLATDVHDACKRIQRTRDRETHTHTQTLCCALDQVRTRPRVEHCAQSSHIGIHNTTDTQT